MGRVKDTYPIEMQRHASIRSDIHRAIDLQNLQKACDRMRTLGLSTQTATELRERVSAIKQELLQINNELHNMDKPLGKS